MAPQPIVGQGIIPQEDVILGKQIETGTKKRKSSRKSEKVSFTGEKKATR